MLIISVMKALTVIVVLFGCFVYDISYNNGETIHWLAYTLGIT
ncbi:hypothetical protein [Hyphomicrobium sp. 99]|nr:hypothetical protein [Hyphomicrobium sp. 99]